MRKNAQALIDSALARYALGLLLICVFAIVSYVLLDRSLQRANSVDRVLTEAADLRADIHQTLAIARQIQDALVVSNAGPVDLGLKLRTQSDALDRHLVTFAAALDDSSLKDILESPATTELHDSVLNMARGARLLAEAVLRGESRPPFGDLLASEAPSGQDNGMTVRGAPAALAETFIGLLRQQTEADRSQVSVIHASLLAATLLVLAIEALLVFRPLLSTARREAQIAAAAEEELLWLATHDPLTGLSNRYAFERKLEEMSGGSKPFALLLADLDRFKAVNDELGHQAGDTVLKEVAKRISSELRVGDFAARLGGDEFVILLSGCDSHHACLSVAGRFKRESEKPIDIGGTETSVGFSAGCALWPVHGQAPRDLVAAADGAMYKAKRNGLNDCIVHDPNESLREAAAVTDLHHMLLEGAIIPHYQDIVDITLGVPVRLEALARFMYNGQLLRPASFLAKLSAAGLMVELTVAMAEAVARDVAAWREAGVDVPAVSINIPAEGLSSHDLGRRIATILRMNGLTPDSMVLEISEAVHISERDDESWLGIERLKDHGFEISYDDFGTDRTTLAQLLHPAVSEIKLDRRFVTDLAHSHSASTLIACIQQTVRLMGKQLVVEGVETAEEAEVIKNCGCTLVQGYFYGKPRSGAETLADFRRAGAEQKRSVRRPTAA